MPTYTPRHETFVSETRSIVNVLPRRTGGTAVDPLVAGQALAAASWPVVLPAAQDGIVSVPVGTATHSTTATSAAAVDTTCPAGTRFVEIWCGSDFYLKRAATATSGNDYYPAGRHAVPFYSAASGTLSVLVTSGSNTRLDVQAMGIA